MLSRRRRLLISFAALLLVLLVGGRVATEFVVDLLWYRSLDLESVFWRRLAISAAVRGGVALLAGLFVFGNLWVVSRSLGAIRVRRRYGNIEIAERLPQRYVLGVLLLLSALSAWWLSAVPADPLAVLAALDATAWGVTDPVFGRDSAFYVFVLPVLWGMRALAAALVVWTALLSAIAYVATGAIRMDDGRLVSSATARRHLGLLLSAFLLLYAAGLWLDRSGLVVQGGGIDGALGYTDVHARIPGLAISALVTVAAAAAVAYGAWRDRRVPPIAATLALVLTVLGARLAYPAFVQRVRVEPNEFPRERPFIERHIEATLEAYGLGEMERRPLAYRPTPSESLSRSALGERLAGVPLWDPRPLQVAFEQRQSLFPYYGFLSVALDRYGEPGSEEQVAISVRELLPEQLPQSAQTWQNLHLNYVSGEGAVVSPVTGMSADGSPQYYLSDLDPPRRAANAPTALELEDPSVYFGEATRGYGLLPPDAPPRGVELGGLVRRLAFAWAFQSANLLLSDDIGPTSRIVYRRTVVERARAAAPFLHFAGESPHPVVHDGHIVWIVDGYTQSSTYPLSRLASFGGARVRYVRNSAKVVVDGLTGEVEVYAIEPDPLLRTWSRIFPGLVRPLVEMPDGLRRHLRFPTSLQGLQAELLGEYHLSDARAFYEKDDVWNVATENYRSESVPMRSTFASLIMPGADRPEFLLMIPFVAGGRQNMTAILSTGNDPDRYGRQTLHLLPRDELVPGPQQIESMIDQQPEISQQLALWRRGGSEVIRGHLIVVPLDSTLVYVEPLYLEAENTAIPQLERVIVAQGGRVVMQPTLDAAVAALVGDAGDAEADRTVSTPTGATPPETTIATEMDRARRLLEQAEAQLRSGDWAGFGRTWQALRRLLGAPDGGS